MVDEVASDCDLRADITELCRNAPEKSVLVAKRLIRISSGIRSYFGLDSHVCICNFRNRGEEEYDD